MDSIEGMKCPECGYTDSFEIELGTFCTIDADDNMMDTGDFSDWNEASRAKCPILKCCFEGTVAEFLDADTQAATEPAKHTPGPWELKKGGHEYWYIMANKGESQVALIGVMTVAPGAPEANAERIVLAVNCHDDLLAACKAALVDVAKILGLFDECSYLEDLDDLGVYSTAEGIRDRHAAAIANVEGKPKC